MLNTNDLHPLVHDLMDKFVKTCKDSNIDIVITQGVRTISYQDELYAQGRRGKKGEVIVTNCKGGWSPHNYGLAFDFAIRENNQITWDSRNKKWSEAGEIGEKLGLTWGGRWKKFVDLPHLEYMFGLTIQQLLKGSRPPKTEKIHMISELKNIQKNKIIKVGQDLYKIV